MHLLILHMPITSFTSHFAVYKMVHTSKHRTEHFAGVLVDQSTKTVVWDNDTTCTYGDRTTEVDNRTFYTDASLAEDMAAGKLLYDSVEILVNGNQPPKLPVSSATCHVARAIDKARACYPKPGSATTTRTRGPPKGPKPKPAWLIWLEGCITACHKATGKLLLYIQFLVTFFTTVTVSRYPKKAQRKGPKRTEKS